MGSNIHNFTIYDCYNNSNFYKRDVDEKIRRILYLKNFIVNKSIKKNIIMIISDKSIYLVEIISTKEIKKITNSDK